MFTRLSNFTYGNYNIANISENDLDTQLLIQMQKYEKECLEFIFPESMINDLMSNVELDGLYWKLKDTAEEKWRWLINGHSYQDDSEVSKKWTGLIKKVAVIQGKEVFETLMAPYIFYKYSLNERTINTGTGEAKLKADNTTQTSAHNKRCDAWNEFLQWVSIGFSSTSVSLYQFLYFHKELYGEVIFLDLKTHTYYDI